MAQHPTIQRGSRGQAVTLAQQNLLNRGYSVGPAGVDGIFGNHTYAAVVNYQTDRSATGFWRLTFPLDVDGIVGPQTWFRLDPDTIKRGDKGTGVRLAQAILKDTAVPQWDPGPVDGDFGPQTEMAVKAFQTDVGLTPVDGIVGPKTWTALWS